MSENEVEAVGVTVARTFKLDFRIQLTAVVTPEEVGGFSASVTDLPGCVTEAETLEELRKNLRDASEGWIAAHAEQIREWVAANSVEMSPAEITPPRRSRRRVLRPNEESPAKERS